jgi:hypothetical protein
MGRPADKDVADGPPPSDQPAGKVEHDARGKAVWRWAADVLESTSVLLKRLENRALSLEPTQKVPVIRDADRAGAKQTGRRGAKDDPDEDLSLQHPAASRGKGRDNGGGFDPYNSR